MKTRITELFGIEHPIIQGGMHFVGLAELAAAVSNAGGLGIITALTQGTPEKLEREIKRAQSLTDKPLGVNLTFLPAFNKPPYAELIQVTTECGIRAVETAGRSPEDYMPQLKAAIKELQSQGFDTGDVEASVVPLCEAMKKLPPYGGGLALEGTAVAGQFQPLPVQ